MPLREFYCDSRMGGIARWVHDDPALALMRVPDDVLACVLFLCIKKRGKFEYLGTGFLVSIPAPLADGNYYYCVTAKHCVEYAQRNKYPLYARMNTRDGGAETFELFHDNWVLSSDGSDVAVTSVVPPENRYEYKVLDVAFALTDDKIKEHGIGVGDELIISGLFSERAGNKRSLPIVRGGIISAMPTEKMQDDDGEYSAYLAEVRSIGGLSGSPVFVFLTPGRVHPVAGITSHRTVFLLGMIRGHWDYSGRNLPQGYGPAELKAVNMGMAVVTPIQEVAKILLGNEFSNGREKEDKSRVLHRAPVKDAKKIMPSTSEKLEREQ